MNTYPRFVAFSFSLALIYLIVTYGIFYYMLRDGFSNMEATFLSLLTGFIFIIVSLTGSTFFLYDYKKDCLINRKKIIKGFYQFGLISLHSILFILILDYNVSSLSSFFTMFLLCQKDSTALHKCSSTFKCMLSCHQQCFQRVQGLKRNDQNAMTDLYRVRRPASQSGGPTSTKPESKPGSSATPTLPSSESMEHESSRIRKLEKLIKKRLQISGRNKKHEFLPTASQFSVQNRG